MAAAAPFIVMGVSALASGIGAVVSANQQKKAADANNKLAQQNFELQQQKYADDQQLQSTIMEREDNAIQRQVDDSRAANISPLANMTGASSGGAAGVQTAAAQHQGNQDSPSVAATAMQQIGTLGALVQTMTQLRGMQLDNAQSLQSTMFNESANPLRLDSMRLSNNFASDSFEDRLSQIKLANAASRQSYAFNEKANPLRLNAMSLSNSASQAHYDDFMREYNYRKKNDIYMSDPQLLKQINGVTGFLSSALRGENENLNSISNSVSDAAAKVAKQLTTAVTPTEKEKSNKGFFKSFKDSVQSHFDTGKRNLNRLKNSISGGSR